MIGVPGLDRGAMAQALRRLADAVESGQATIENFVVHNELDLHPVDDPTVADDQRTDAVFRGQHVKLEATSIRVILGDA